MVAVLCVHRPLLAQSWVTFVNETATRLPTPPNPPTSSTTDDSERSYAFGDVDQDGDLDLVVARRQAYSVNPRANVLFMNESVAEGHAINGVLIDRTALHAGESDVAGDQGFLTPTSDRDVILTDVNNDGWLDIVTAVAWAETQPKHLSHPRIYINKGEVGGVWQGFRHEDARVPQLHPMFGPRFASVSAGDVTGDGFVDLWFTDFDVSESPMTTDPFDFNNRLLINNGKGFFTDETGLRMTAAMSNSAYGASGAIADMNGDGFNDLVRQSANLNPVNVAINYNNPANQGIFNIHDVVYALPPGNPYFVSVGDLNADGKFDLIITDNNTDRYLLNTGNDVDGSALFQTKQFPFIGFDFGGNSYAADLDRDGFNDVLITDMDVDVPGCFRRMHIYRNLANPPGVDFAEPIVIPTNMLTGTHDVAVFDINGDDWLDLVIGRCSGTQVWMNVPPQIPCDEDITNDFEVNVDDLLAVINNWGFCVNTCPPGCLGDIDWSCAVNVDDLLAVINAWGPCE
jgi:hypothetical protein